MKNRIKIVGIAFMLIIGLGACERAYLEPEKSQPKTESVADDLKDVEATTALGDRITNGVWRIASFQWHNKENNDHFKGYVFYFLPNGTVVAVHYNTKDIGKWNRKGTLFRLNFGSERPLKELNNNRWYFIRESSDKFILKGLSPYDNSSQYVEFVRL